MTAPAYYVDGVRIPIGRASDTGYYAHTRADDMSVRTIRALLDRQESMPGNAIDDVAWAATAQVGDQGLTLGRSLALLAGLGTEVPGYAIDRMCAGAMTAVSNGANAIKAGMNDLVLAGGVEHMGHHPMGEEVDPNPRFLADRLVDMSALVMGQTAENLHDAHPEVTRQRADTYALQSQERTAKAMADGFFDTHLVPMAVRTPDGVRNVTHDEHPRPDTTMADLQALQSPFRAGGRVTAGNAAGLNDGAGATLLASQAAVDEYGLQPRMRLVDATFVGVQPETMGWGPVPATDQLLVRNGLTMDDIDIVEMNEAFAIQCVAFLDHYELPIDTDKVNPHGGAIALGHPLAFSGARLAMQLAGHFDRDPDARRGITTMCIGLGMGVSVLWDRA